jgi:hypothetical protein
LETREGFTLSVLRIFTGQATAGTFLDVIFAALKELWDQPEVTETHDFNSGELAFTDWV